MQIYSRMRNQLLTYFCLRVSWGHGLRSKIKYFGQLYKLSYIYTLLYFHLIQRFVNTFFYGKNNALILQLGPAYRCQTTLTVYTKLFLPNKGNLGLGHRWLEVVPGIFMILNNYRGSGLYIKQRLSNIWQLYLINYIIRQANRYIDKTIYVKCLEEKYLQYGSKKFKSQFF